MKLSLKEIVEIIRDELGNPLEAEITEKSLELSYKKAVREYSKYRPIKVLEKVAIIPGQSDYPIGEEYFDAKEIVFCEEKNWNLAYRHEMPGISEMDNPSLQVILTQKHEYNTMRGITEYTIENETIRLIPTPTTRGFLMYTGTTTHKIEEEIIGEDEEGIEVKEYYYPTIVEKDFELVKQYALGESMIKLGRNRNKRVKEVPTVTGEVKFDMGYNWRFEGQRLIDDFHQKLGVLGMPVVIG